VYRQNEERLAVRTKAKALIGRRTDAEGRRFEEQRGLETLVVQTVNKAIRSAEVRK